MKRLEGNKLVAVILSAGMLTTFLAACSVNTDKLERGLNDLGNAFVTTAAPKETDPTTTEATSAAPSEEETTVSSSEETTSTATTTAYANPTITPTPLPERVDFSNYVEKDLTDNFAVTSEEFGESAYTDDQNQVLLAKFEGTRLVVTKASNESVMNSINLIINGFYKEAEGAYTRVLAKAKAEYDLNGVIENSYSVTCDFIYTTNARALSVLMVYEVSGKDGAKNTVIDFASFDMLTGQYITLNSICKDPSGLENALRAGLANSLKIQPKANTDETEETDKKAKEEPVPTEKDFTAIYLAPGPATTDPQANSFVTIYGVVGNKVYSAVIDMNAYSGFLNRYGSSLIFS